MQGPRKHSAIHGLVMCPGTGCTKEASVNSLGCTVAWHYQPPILTHLGLYDTHITTT